MGQFPTAMKTLGSILGNEVKMIGGAVIDPFKYALGEKHPWSSIQDAGRQWWKDVSQKDPWAKTDKPNLNLNALTPVASGHFTGHAYSGNIKSVVPPSQVAKISDPKVKYFKAQVRGQPAKVFRSGNHLADAAAAPGFRDAMNSGSLVGTGPSANINSAGGQGILNSKDVTKNQVDVAGGGGDQGVDQGLQAPIATGAITTGAVTADTQSPST